MCKKFCKYMLNYFYVSFSEAEVRTDPLEDPEIQEIDYCETTQEPDTHLEEVVDPDDLVPSQPVSDNGNHNSCTLFIYTHRQHFNSFDDLYTALILFYCRS